MPLYCATVQVGKKKKTTYEKGVLSPQSTPPSYYTAHKQNCNMLHTYVCHTTSFYFTYYFLCTYIRKLHLTCNIMYVVTFSLGIWVLFDVIPDRILIGESLSKPHTSDTAYFRSVHLCIYMYVCIYLCIRTSLPSEAPDTYALRNLLQLVNKNILQIF